jgi:hypothetical protein
MQLYKDENTGIKVKVKGGTSFADIVTKLKATINIVAQIANDAKSAAVLDTPEKAAKALQAEADVFDQLVVLKPIPVGIGSGFVLEIDKIPVQNLQLLAPMISHNLVKSMGVLLSKDGNNVLMFAPSATPAHIAEQLLKLKKDLTKATAVKHSVMPPSLSGFMDDIVQPMPMSSPNANLIYMDYKYGDDLKKEYASKLVDKLVVLSNEVVEAEKTVALKATANEILWKVATTTNPSEADSAAALKILNEGLPFKCNMYLDTVPVHGKVAALKSPYNVEFLAAMKSTLQFKKWDPIKKVWYVMLTDALTVKALMIKHYPFLGKSPKSPAHSALPYGHVTIIPGCKGR